MKTTTGIILAAALALLMSACIMTGQNTFIMGIEVGATTNTTITPILVDLNEEPDYADNKDNIKSVDEISVVAIITNNLPAPATARLYLSNDESLTTVEDIEAEATLVYESPTIPASAPFELIRRMRIPPRSGAMIAGANAVNAFTMISNRFIP